MTLSKGVSVVKDGVWFISNKTGSHLSVSITSNPNN